MAHSVFMEGNIKFFLLSKQVSEQDYIFQTAFLLQWHINSVQSHHYEELHCQKLQKITTSSESSSLKATKGANPKATTVHRNN